MNIRKLTPRILKRIISEEKIKLESKKRKAKISPKKNKAKKINEEKSVKQLKLMKKRQAILLNEIKKLHLARKKIKKQLIKSL